MFFFHDADDKKRVQERTQHILAGEDPNRRQSAQLTSVPEGRFVQVQDPRALGKKDERVMFRLVPPGRSKTIYEKPLWKEGKEIINRKQQFPVERVIAGVGRDELVSRRVEIVGKCRAFG